MGGTGGHGAVRLRFDGRDLMPRRMTLRDRLAAADRALAGIWVCSGSPLVAEICAGSGMDWTLIDMEHSPNALEEETAGRWAGPDAREYGGGSKSMGVHTIPDAAQRYTTRREPEHTDIPPTARPA